MSIFGAHPIFAATDSIVDHSDWLSMRDSDTLSGVLAPALGSAALQWARVLGFPALLLAVAAPGWWWLGRVRKREA